MTEEQEKEMRVKLKQVLKEADSLKKKVQSFQLQKPQAPRPPAVRPVIRKGSQRGR